MKLIPPQFVKPYVKRGKNDAADAEALCEAMSRPTMRFVPVKTRRAASGPDAGGLARPADPQRTQLANAIRGYAAEFGLIAATGIAGSSRCWSGSKRTTRCRRWPASSSSSMPRNTPSCRPGLEEVEDKLMALAPRQ